MPTQDSIVAQMRQTLQISEPGLDTSIGSPVRLILDAVGEVVAEQTAEQYLLGYQYDIDSMSGADLDTFTQLFGIARYPAVRATGFITLSSGHISGQTLSFGAGAQVQTTSSPPVLFATIVPASIPAGATPSVTIPIQAIVAGSAGNVAANTITQAVSPLMSISSVTNVSSCTGGADAESDDQLRGRFKNTVFRGMFGTESMFAGVAQDTSLVSQVNVLGASKTYYDQIQFIGGVAQSSVDDLAYLYPQTDYITNASSTFYARSQYSIEVIPLTPSAPTLTPSGSGGTIAAGTQTYALVVQYPGGSTTIGASASTTTSGSTSSVALAWSAFANATNILIYKNVAGVWHLLHTSAGGATSYTDTTGTTTTAWSIPVPPPSGAIFVNSLDSVNLPNGTYSFQFDYVPTLSRNDPPNNITNRIDVFVNGDGETEAIQNVAFASAITFNNTDLVDIEHGAVSMNVLEFSRLDGTNPTAGNYFLQLANAPVTDMGTQFQAASVIVNGVNYNEGTDYWIVNESSQYGYSSRSRSGIEINSALAATFTGHSVAVDYLYNSTPSNVASRIDLWRLATTDVMVHAVQYVYLDMYFALILAQGQYSTAGVYTQAQTAIQNYLSSVLFNGVVQVSEILSVLQQIPGVTAVRFLNSGDSAAVLYGTGPLNGSAAGSHYAIEQVNIVTDTMTRRWATTSGSPYRAIDVPLNDGQLVSLNNLYLTQMSQATFGSV